jgi:hypothetical protein
MFFSSHSTIKFTVENSVTKYHKNQSRVCIVVLRDPSSAVAMRSYIKHIDEKITGVERFTHKYFSVHSLRSCIPSLALMFLCCRCNCLLQTYHAVRSEIIFSCVSLNAHRAQKRELWSYIFARLFHVSLFCVMNYYRENRSHSIWASCRIEVILDR